MYAIGNSFLFATFLALSAGITLLMLMTENKEGRWMWKILFGRRERLFKRELNESESRCRYGDRLEVLVYKGPTIEKGYEFWEVTTFSFRKSVLTFGFVTLAAYAVWYYYGPEHGAIATGIALGFILAVMQAMLFAWVENERENEENLAGIPADESSDDK